MPKVIRQRVNTPIYSPYPVYSRKNTFAALEDPITPQEKFKQMLATNPMMAALANTTISWADLLLNDEAPVTAAEQLEIDDARSIAAAAYKASMAIAQSKMAHANHKLVMSELKALPEARLVAQENLDTYYSAKQEWLNSQLEYVEEDPDTLGMGWETHWDDRYDDWFKHATKDIHRDASGEPEICRFFNTPGGCHLQNGKKCPYKHVTGSIAEPCRFFNSPRGCKNGSSCPFRHVQEGPSWRTPAAGGQTVVDCKFFRSARGCAKGTKCPFKH